MLAKLTSKNQLTLPKSVTDRLGPVQYFEVQLQAGQVVLTPVRIQRGDAVRAKLVELDLAEDVAEQALAWARQPAGKGAKVTAKVTRAKAVPVKTAKAAAAPKVPKASKPRTKVKVKTSPAQVDAAKPARKTAARATPSSPQRATKTPQPA